MPPVVRRDPLLFLMRYLPPFILAAAVACQSGSTPKQPASAPQPLAHSLSGLAGQVIVVLPVYAVRVMPDLPWGPAIGPAADVERRLDADIAAALTERGLGKTWIFPPQLEQSYRRNSPYAADPHALAEEPLRGRSLDPDARLPDPLATQLRTLVALHDDARLILAPVELRFERAGSGGRGVLHLVLIDPRFSAVRWTGDIASDSLPEFSPAISANIAAKFANVIATR
jgi:hypothetical protein